ncbi:MAG: NAD(+)/NADH kinase, partial [Anaeroplasmataceae bacterium]
MKYFIVSKDDSKSLDIYNRLKKEIKHEYNKDAPDLVISIGGDGTILEAIHNYINLDNVSFLGIHTGHLGFLTNFSFDEVDKLIKVVNDKKFLTEEINLLEYTIKDNGVIKN